MKNLVKEQGFSLVRTKELAELDAILYELVHDKTGAELIYINRRDENKTFAIAFPTPPENDTGVFHIIEHSVLCGSKKYPLKDPFAELLKSSLNTFLNAITYEDRTVYPVSSRCEKDFLNLVDVYMDAVLAPNLLENPSIFAQEGWHYEYDEESDTLSYNGVVYNEMKGAYSSPDELGGMALYQSLYSDSIYSRDAGGNPDVIPELTYEMVKATHEKHYHPSGAKIILDGEMDLSLVLSLINSHLSRYESREAVVLDSLSSPKIAPTKTVSYEISPKENPEGKARVLFGYAFSDYADKEAQLAASILADLLCGSNASPLKKSLLEQGLAKDAAIYMNRARHQTVTLEVRDTSPDKFEKIKETVDSVIKKLVQDGIDRDRLTSVINNLEFKLRERDFGALPSGIAFAMSIYGCWMYGGAPEDALLFEDTLKSLREKLSTDYYERTLEQMTLNNPHRATVIMLPDPTLNEKNAKARAELLKNIRNSLSDEDIEKIKREEDALRQWQMSEESEEDLASIPRLSLTDVSSKTSSPSIIEGQLDGVKILVPQVKTNGIVYISLYFDASDLKTEELFTLSILCSALLNFRTDAKDVLELQTDIKSNLGSFFTATDIGTAGEVATPYLKVGASVLISKLDDLLRITSDVLLSSKIDKPTEIKNLLSQAKSQIEDVILSSGESIALSRVEAGISQVGTITEYFSGYEAYKIICDILEDEEKIKSLTTSCAELLKKIVTKNRLTVSVNGDPGEIFLKKLISIFPEGSPIAEHSEIPLLSDESEFFLIPSKVAYAVIGAGAPEVRDNLGFMRVARSILSYEYLWNTIRVKNGAYGTGFVPRRDGSVAFYSYRDPSPVNSLKYYREASAYLRALAEEGEELTKFIIGAIGEYDMLTTPRTASLIATKNYLNGWSCEDEQKVRDSMLSMKTEDLFFVADLIDRALEKARTVIVGGKEHLDALDENPKTIIEI